ncbi:hypothetical protein Tamer19_67600 [Cupriavidus sp. TA19]|nr:hypothetical protein Tamer19_67600 [Cupriavidus sp. TA19]
MHADINMGHGGAGGKQRHRPRQQGGNKNRRQHWVSFCRNWNGCTVPGIPVTGCGGLFPFITACKRDLAKGSPIPKPQGPHAAAPGGMTGVTPAWGNESSAANAA